MYAVGSDIPIEPLKVYVVRLICNFWASDLGMWNLVESCSVYFNVKMRINIDLTTIQSRLELVFYISTFDTHFAYTESMSRDPRS